MLERKPHKFIPGLYSIGELTRHIPIVSREVEDFI